MDSEAWYRYKWPWVLILLPFSAVVFGFFMLAVVLLHPDDLVDDNYYQDGMAINRTLDMDNNARHLHISAKLTNFGGGKMAFAVDGATDSALLLKFYHVTDRNKDMAFTLYPEQNNIYAATGGIPADLEQQGVWYVELIGVDNNWRLRQRIESPLVKLDLEPE